MTGRLHLRVALQQHVINPNNQLIKNWL